MSQITDDAELLPQHLESLETTLTASYQCYKKALSLKPLDMDRNNLLRRMGNIHNELGVLYMNQAGSKCMQLRTFLCLRNAIIICYSYVILFSARYQQENLSDETTSSIDSEEHLLARSLNHLEAGVKAFETVHDEANLALLHSNTGRLMRLCAHMHAKQNAQERHFYNKALASYQKALQVLSSRKSNPMIWDTITWDLSTTLFTMATLLQDYPITGCKVCYFIFVHINFQKMSMGFHCLLPIVILRV